MFYLITLSALFYLRLYGKGPFRQRDMKPSAATT